MKQRVVIRCDGGTDIGMGHVVRCLALADMLKTEFEVSFVLRETEETVYAWITDAGFSFHLIDRKKEIRTDYQDLQKFLKEDDIIVLDGYHFRSDYQQSLIKAGYQVLAIDDLHAWHHYADMVINHADLDDPDVYEVSDYTSLFTGPSFVLLRKDFFKVKKTKSKPAAGISVMISMGAADTGNLTCKFCEWMVLWDEIKKIKLLASEVNPHLKDIRNLASVYGEKIEVLSNIQASDLVICLDDSDLMICPASSISLEACSRGIGLLTGYTAANQKGILSGLSKRNACINAGDLNKLDEDSLRHHLKTLFEGDQTLEKMLIAQSILIDGQSPQRIRQIFRDLADRRNRMWFRQARRSDLLTYYEWANDPAVRANSFSTEPIPLESHETWFNRTLKDTNQHMLLFFYRRHAIGQIRLSISEGQAIVNYSISNEHRGKGYAKEILLQAERYLIDSCPQVASILAKVKPSNQASCKAFENCSYALSQQNSEEIVYIKKLR